MNAIASITRRSLDKLEDDIISLSSHMNAMEYEFLVLVREFDLRQGWKACQLNSCATGQPLLWLNYKCGMATGTAREKLRVANALFDLPQTSSAFQKGDLSYSKARALSRIATPTTEDHLLDFAVRATAAHVDRHCRELRNVRRDISVKDANRLHENRYLSCSPHSDGSVTLSVELPMESADLVMKALEKAASPDVADLFKQQADALVELARSYLSGGSDGKSCTADHYQVTVMRQPSLWMRVHYVVRRMRRAKAIYPLRPCDGFVATVLWLQRLMMSLGTPKI
jgi:hypothetical protein